MSPELLGLILGVVFIVPTIRITQTRGWDSVAWPFFLATLPLYYMLFGLLAQDASVILKELLYGVPYVITALIVRRIRSATTLVVIALAWLSHGLYDFYHDLFFVNPGVFSWYPAFCALIDVVVAVYLLACWQRLARPGTATDTQ